MSNALVKFSVDVRKVVEGSGADILKRVLRSDTGLRLGCNGGLLAELAVSTSYFLK